MTMERSITAFPFALFASLASALVLAVQAQPGFISIDCGAPNEYTDENTNITYKMDDGFISSGKNMQTLMWYENNLQLNTDQPPLFDLYIDVNYWATVDFSFHIIKEIIYVPKADDIRVCLVNTGNGVPFISALELRALEDDIYPLGSGFLQVRKRYNLGRTSAADRFRYPHDVYDRLWPFRNFRNWSILNTTSAIDLSNNSNAYKVPDKVLQTAQGTMSLSSPLYLQWTVDSPPTNDAVSLPRAPPKIWIVYLHFMEIERLSGPQREFTISINDNQFMETVSLEYLKPVVVVSPPVSGPLITLSISSTSKSGNPPILNAMEVYNVVDLTNVPTAKDDESSERALKLKNRPFEYGEISKITQNFGQVIGKGGFGKVYLGTLDNDTIVAVKILSESSEQGYKEFQAEAQLLAILHHGNLVSLFGYCDDSKHKALVYEYMANGNLRQNLSEDHPKVLTWSKRLQIAVDAAQGLDYLHNGCKPPIIHRDLKTSNILLSEDFRAKIADFGLSRAFASEDDSHVSTRLAGTIGYLSPE
ncbi:putative leucine-rich repeat receptor-like serine/threonine-protein kinase At2g19230 [Eucalyptus grandis]|uniref:putative leucine-rich repeat receptor-like serine/threonine-protein kinase At2g19230 n=1 Tax=Eucalyptus grandis TaxID=71139 RepID=UPI00192E910D|nr:putative leucine-rich repeat receptor-like serine/threonine-protein kinase At2g19230 [Eucalyptus grandis]